MYTDKINISIEGNIGVGKEVLKQYLKKRINKELIYVNMKIKYEDCDKNIEDMFYINSKEYYWENMWINVTNLVNTYTIHKNTITTRSIGSFMNVLLPSSRDINMIDNKSYERLQECLMSYKYFTPPIKYIIYININPHDLYDYLISNNIYDGINMTMMYKIHIYYEEYLNKLKDVNILRIELTTNNLNDIYFSNRLPKCVQKEIDNWINTICPSLINL